MKTLFSSMVLAAAIALTPVLAQAQTGLQTARANLAQYRRLLAQEENLLTLLAGGPLDIPSSVMRGTVYRFEAGSPLSLPDEEGPRFSADPAFQVEAPNVDKPEADAPPSSPVKKGNADAR